MVASRNNDDPQSGTEPGIRVGGNVSGNIVVGSHNDVRWYSGAGSGEVSNYSATRSRVSTSPAEQSSPSRQTPSDDGTQCADVWDFFVSYTESDRPWAEWIAWQLEDAGYRVHTRAWDSVPGTHRLEVMQRGVSNSARTLAVLSNDYLMSALRQAEWQAAWQADPRGLGRTLIPVRVESCELPGLLQGIEAIDLFGLSVDAALNELARRIEVALSGRAKPSVAPVFPGENDA